MMAYAPASFKTHYRSLTVASGRRAHDGFRSRLGTLGLGCVKAKGDSSEEVVAVKRGSW